MKRLLIYSFFVFSQILYARTPSITIYVHGSQNASKILSKDIWYCQKGLHHINELPETSLFVKDAQLLQQNNKDLFNMEHYYTFGWSGKIDFKHREHAGRDLYVAIKKLLKEYKKKYHAYPMIRIITFSHGGNVALNMVKELPFHKKRKIVLELILVACPVQKVTEHLINHSCITKSYIIYSTFDVIQVLDYYKHGGKTYFPNRYFDTHKDNCTQILVTVNGKRISHTDLCHSFMRHIPATLQAAQTTCIDNNRCTKYNVIDPGFTFYNGFNITRSLKATRKNEKTKKSKHNNRKKT